MGEKRFAKMTLRSVGFFSLLTVLESKASFLALWRAGSPAAPSAQGGRALPFLIQQMDLGQFSSLDLQNPPNHEKQRKSSPEW